MAEISKAEKQKTSVFDRLPKLGRVSRLILLIGIFLIILIPLVLVQSTERAKQEGYRQEIQMLEKIVSTPGAQITQLEDDIRRAETNLNLKKEKFPLESKNTSVIDELVSLADSSGVYITEVTSSVAETAMMVGNTKTTYPSLTCTVNMEGDSANFQNYLATINTLDTCTINSVTINITENESDMDTATLNLQILLRE